MKSPANWLVTLYQPAADSVKWRILLRFLGVESTPLQDEKELGKVLLHDPPGLLIIDRALLGEAFAAMASLSLKWLERGGGIALTGHGGLWPLPDSFLAQVTDITDRDPYTINALLQRFVPTYSRQHPRLETRLPGLYARVSGNSQICEIMNLSPAGAFLRTTEALPLSGEEVLMSVPLMGMHREIELYSRVVRQVLPNEVNNYAQGIGVKFTPENNAALFDELDNYVRYVLAHDEALDPQVTPFSGCRSSRKELEANDLLTRPAKGRERLFASFR